MQESIMNTDLFRVVKLVLNFPCLTLYISLSIERESKMHYDVCQTRKKALSLKQHP